MEFAENGLLHMEHTDRYVLIWLTEMDSNIWKKSIHHLEEVVVTEKPALKYLGVEDFGEKKGFFAKVRGVWARLVGERKWLKAVVFYSKIES